MFIAGSTNCVQLGVACGWLSYGLKCKLLIDVFVLTRALRCGPSLGRRAATAGKGADRIAK